MMDHNYNPYEKMLELEINVLHLQQNYDELVRQHRNMCKTVEQITEHLKHITALIQTQQIMHNELEYRVTEQELK